jgi:hypothetical protein
VAWRLNFIYYPKISIKLSKQAKQAKQADRFDLSSQASQLQVRKVSSQQAKAFRLGLLA